MYRSILVPLDGSEFAERAIPPAVDLARTAGARIELASVVADLPPVHLADADPKLVDVWVTDERNRVGEYLARVREGILRDEGAVKVDVVTLEGSTVEALGNYLAEGEVDLVVMTSHGRGPVQRAWMGSVADGLLRRDTPPLLLLRPEGGEEGGEQELALDLQHLLVTLDGSTMAEDILGPASALAALSKARVTLLSVAPRPLPFGTYMPHVVQEEEDERKRRDELKGYLDSVGARVRERGLTVEAAVIVHAQPATGILEFAVEKGVDAIAMSTHGRGGISRMVIGSVADKVIRGSQLPVLAHRAPEHD